MNHVTTVCRWYIVCMASSPPQYIRSIACGRSVWSSITSIYHSVHGKHEKHDTLITRFTSVYH